MDEWSFLGITFHEIFGLVICLFLSPISLTSPIVSFETTLDPIALNGVGLILTGYFLGTGVLDPTGILSFIGELSTSTLGI